MSVVQRTSDLQEDLPVSAPSQELLSRLQSLVLDHVASQKKTSLQLQNLQNQVPQPQSQVQREISGEKAFPEENLPIKSFGAEDYRGILPCRWPSGSEELYKIVVIFATLLEKVDQLEELARSTFYGPLAMFGENMQDPAKKSFSEMEISLTIPFLRKLLEYLANLNATIANILLQMHSVYDKESGFGSWFHSIHLDRMILALGKLLRISLTLHLIVEDNENLNKAWVAYKTMFRYARAEPASFLNSSNLTEDSHNIEKLEDLLLKFDSNIFNSNIFPSALAALYTILQSSNDNKSFLVEKNELFSNELRKRTEVIFHKFVTNIGELLEYYPRESVVEIYCLFALHLRLFAHSYSVPPKTYKLLWGFQSK